MTTVWGWAARLHAQASVGRQALELIRHEAVGQGQVDEPGPADLHHGTHMAEGERGGHVLGDVPWGPAHLLGQGQGAVGLEVGPLGGAQGGVRAGHDGVEGFLELVAQHAGDIGHPSLSHGRAWRPAPRPLRQSAGAPMAPSMSP